MYIRIGVSVLRIIVNRCVSQNFRAHYFYASSLKQAVCLADKVCHGNPHKIPKTCVSLRNTTEVRNLTQLLIHLV